MPTPPNDPRRFKLEHLGPRFGICLKPVSDEQPPIREVGALCWGVPAVEVAPLVPGPQKPYQNPPPKPYSPSSNL